METTITLTFQEKMTLKMFLKEAEKNNNWLLKIDAQELLKKLI